MKIKNLILLTFSITLISCVNIGCTDSEAMNYIPSANVGDKSCKYQNYKFS